MNKRIIFVSCGQFTQEEKNLGKAIVSMVDAMPGLKAYFAEEVQDLNGLDFNILMKLRQAAGFITVLHPRGEIQRHDGTAQRASVWIEQEIAIATYIRQIEKRPLPVIAFIHESVALEGIRSLLQLNPAHFRHESEVIEQLRIRLESWKNLFENSGALRMQSTSIMVHDGHNTRHLILRFTNNTNKHIGALEGELRIPAPNLRHWYNTGGYLEEAVNDWGGRIFTFNQMHTGPLRPRSVTDLLTYQYCGACVAEAHGGLPIGGELEFKAKVWIDEEEYEASSTIQQLAMDAESRPGDKRQ
jgi:hypothetical protein